MQIFKTILIAFALAWCIQAESLRGQRSLAVTVDGLTSDWVLANNFLANMREAGKPGKVIAAKAYSQLQCDTKTICFLVWAEPTFYLSNTEAWFKDYKVGNSVRVPLSPGIKFVKNGTTMVGWEACYAIPSSDGTSIELHANFGLIGQAASRTASTGKKGSTISVNYSCPWEDIWIWSHDRDIAEHFEARHGIRWTWLLHCTVLAIAKNSAIFYLDIIHTKITIIHCTFSWVSLTSLLLWIWYSIVHTSHKQGFWPFPCKK